MRGFGIQKTLAGRKRKLFAILLVILTGCYFIFIHKSSSPEFLGLQRQEKALNLPKPWRRDTSDFGCQWVAWSEETECSRNIALVYEDTGVKPTIERSLIRHGWAAHKDSTINLKGRDFDKTQITHFESWDLYVKESSQGKLCAVLKAEYNANYKKDGPWAVTLTLFDKTERCDDHVK